jgi:hypothetical protein
MGDVIQDWDHKNQHMIMPVTFTFRDWYEESVGSIGDLIPGLGGGDLFGLGGTGGINGATPLQSFLNVTSQTVANIIRFI